MQNPTIEQNLSENEVRDSDLASLVRDVAEMLGSKLGLEPPIEFVGLLAMDMLSSSFEDFFLISTHPTPGTPHHTIEGTWLWDEFGRDLAATANQLLTRRAH